MPRRSDSHDSWADARKRSLRFQSRLLNPDVSSSTFATQRIGHESRKRVRACNVRIVGRGSSKGWKMIFVRRSVSRRHVRNDGVNGEFLRHRCDRSARVSASACDRTGIRARRHGKHRWKRLAPCQCYDDRRTVPLERRTPGFRSYSRRHRRFCTVIRTREFLDTDTAASEAMSNVVRLLAMQTRRRSVHPNSLE